MRDIISFVHAKILALRTAVTWLVVTSGVTINKLSIADRKII